MLQTPDGLKTRTGEEAFNPNGLSQRTISQLKDAFPDLEVYTDVALDPYNSDGHDGIVRDDGVIMNDQTIEYLCRQAVSQARRPPLHAVICFLWAAQSADVVDWARLLYRIAQPRTGARTHTCCHSAVRQGCHCTLHLFHA